MKKKPYRIVFYYLFVALRAFFNLFPYAFTVRFCRLLGRLIYYLLPRERQKIMANLRTAFGSEKTEKELAAIARAVFENYGMIAAETHMVHKIIPQMDRWITLEGKEIGDRALAQGRGIIAVVAHFGNWELMGGYLSMRGFPCTVIARKIYYEKYNLLLMQARAKMGLKIIYRDESPREMLKVLKNGTVLGIVADQDVESVDGVFVNFFGRPAYTPIAPVRFALATGAPIIPVFIIREGLRHRVIIEKPIEFTETGNKEQDLVTNTQKWVAVQESYIRRYPHLWVWNHKRWKTQKNKF